MILFILNHYKTKELVISNILGFFWQDAEKSYYNKSALANNPQLLLSLKLWHPQGQIFYVKCQNHNKSAIFKFFSAIIKLV